MRVILDNIRSVHNVGSIFRTADAVGADKIYVCGITPTPVDRFGTLLPDFAKTALGAEKSIAWKKYFTTWRLIEDLKREGFFIVGIEQSPQAKDLFAYVPPVSQEKLILIIGNEVRGLSPSLLKRVDVVLEIPMVGAKESLNVAVAFGVAAYSLVFGGERGL